MCVIPSAPKTKTATQYQASREPVRREASTNTKKGRRGTILTSSSAQGEVSVGGKKTALGT